jgi:uncharacterized protein with PQ loop repeat
MIVRYTHHQQLPEFSFRTTACRMLYIMRGIPIISINNCQNLASVLPLVIFNYVTIYRINQD